MKFKISTVLAVAICLVAVLHALKFIESIEYEVRLKYGLSLQKLKEKCDRRDLHLFKEISQQREKSGRIVAHLAREVAKIIKSKPHTTEKELDQLIKKKCVPNKDLKNISIKVINEVQRCVSKKRQLNSAAKLKAEKDLNARFCWAVKQLAKDEIRSG